ncbi:MULTISPECIES: PQQ-binding-like beta-propeller repeat protein [Streptomyces]|uniref:PQQ-binding-like beta-propeller repeat protein n=1 Tax=Streptomyces ehimensis TaxID=68195 RepID=A0ABV9BQK7_9ACTN
MTGTPKPSNDYVIAPPVPDRQPGLATPHHKGRGALIAMLAAATLVLAGAIGTGVWLLQDPGHENNKPATAGASKASLPWSVPAKVSGLRSPGLVRGVWFTDKAVVHALPDGTAALDRSTGRRMWGTPTPGAGSLCRASTDSTDNIAILAYGAGEDCGTFYALDITTGKVLWQHTLEPDDQAPSGPTRIARSGETVVVSTEKKRTTAFRVRDGREIWHESKELYQATAQGDCRGTQYTGGRILLRVQYCLDGTFNERYDLAALDPVTGKARWTYRLSSEGLHAQVVSTSPIVVNDPGKGLGLPLGLTVLDDNGNLRTRLATGPEHLGKHAEGDGSTPFPDVQIKGDKLYFVAAKDDSTPDQNNKIIAWSLDSGRRLWERTSSGYLQAYHAVASDTNDVLAYTAGNIHDPATLVRFDPATGTPTIVRTYPPTPQEAIVGPFPLPYLNHGTLYLLASPESAVPGWETEKRQKALLALPGT